MVTQISRILVPLDHSPGGDDVLDYAAAIALGLHASVALLHVYSPPNAMVAIVPGTSVAEETESARQSAAELLAGAAARLQEHGLGPVAVTVQRAPSPSLAIVRHARLGAFELIVMGTHGRKGANRALIGSVTEQVLRNAPCAVLAVHLPPE